MLAQILFSIRTHGAKIIWAPTNGIDRKVDEEKYPWELEFDLPHPEFHRLVYVLHYGGTQNFVVRGKSRKALIRLFRVLGVHKRKDLIEAKITDPDGNIEMIKSLLDNSPAHT